MALQRAEQQQARKEDYLREEISELQKVTIYFIPANHQSTELMTGKAGFVSYIPILSVFFSSPAETPGGRDQEPGAESQCYLCNAAPSAPD